VGLSVGVLELEEADRVAIGIDEPGRKREADVGDAVDHLETRYLLECDPARAQLGRLGGEIIDPPRCPGVSSVLPVVLLVTTNRLSPPQAKMMKSSLSRTTSRPILSL
jgi:hypothetical protein